MKLSDVKGARTLEVIAEVIDPVANIAEDEAAAALFRREKLPEGMTAKKFLLQRVRKFLPVLLKKHKADLIAIMAAIEGTDKRDYEDSLSLIKLTRDVTDLLTDEAFGELFISAQSGTLSGSARENTEAPKA